MSVSKLESLPNEILAELLEKYINGIDVINAFAFQLNQRFDALIAQSQRLRFDFIRCRKDEFRLSMGLLPAYMDKIEQLALAERYTPGQIHAFLYFHRSFNAFENLRKLFFQVDAKAVESRMLSIALQSILSMNLHTLSLDITGVESVRSIDDTHFISELFRMKTMRKLLINCDSLQMEWAALQAISSNIEYLTIRGIGCCQTDLAYIFQCASNLKYLDISLGFVTYYRSYNSKSSSKNIPPNMLQLHTLIFNMVDNDQTMFNQLEIYFKSMSSLRHLEIRAHNGLWSITPWEILIKSTLPSLTTFIFEETTDTLTDKDKLSVIESIGTPFWTSKPDFHVIIKHTLSKRTKAFYLDISNNPDRYRWDEVTTLWFVGPERKQRTHSSALDSIHRLHVSDRMDIFSSNVYLNNITHLVVDTLYETLFKLLKTHVNCSRIKYLDLSSINEANSIIPSFLESTNHIKSLRIHSGRLYDGSLSASKPYDSIRNLDISVGEHQFKEQNIIMISKLFPRLEHLTVHTQDLDNVLLLQNYLPFLHSFTFHMTELTDSYFYREHEQQLIDSILRDQVDFFFQRQQSWLTVWLDEAAFQSEYWRTNSSTNNSSRDNGRLRLRRMMEERYYDWN